MSFWKAFWERNPVAGPLRRSRRNCKVRHPYRGSARSGTHSKLQRDREKSVPSLRPRRRLHPRRTPSGCTFLTEVPSDIAVRRDDHGAEVVLRFFFHNRVPSIWALYFSCILVELERATLRNSSVSKSLQSSRLHISFTPTTFLGFYISSLSIISNERALAGSILRSWYLFPYLSIIIIHF